MTKKQITILNYILKSADTPRLQVSHIIDSSQYITNGHLMVRLYEPCFNILISENPSPFIKSLCEEYMWDTPNHTTIYVTDKELTNIARVLRLNKKPQQYTTDDYKKSTYSIKYMKWLIELLKPTEDQITNETLNDMDYLKFETDIGIGVICSILNTN